MFFCHGGNLEGSKMRMVLLLIVVLLAGCVQIKRGDLQYTRWGSQELGSIYVELDPNGVDKLWIGQQKSEFEIGFDAGKLILKGGAE